LWRIGKIGGVFSKRFSQPAALGVSPLLRTSIMKTNENFFHSSMAILLQVRKDKTKNLRKFPLSTSLRLLYDRAAG
jgi:hypothetical protein